MGYETHLVVGRPGLHVETEYKEDKSKPYDDGSGYEYLKDEKGERVPTGRELHYYESYCEMNLHKIYGSQLEALIKKYRDQQKSNNTYPYIFGVDGNFRFMEDNYGDKLTVVPFDEAQAALVKDVQRSDYRRFTWAKGMLEGVNHQRSEDVVCLFYGS